VTCKTCGTETKRWRQCPVKVCGCEIAYCDTCGGDQKAVQEMKDHIKGHLKAA